MHPMLNIAVRAARRAGDIINRSIDRLHRIEVNPKGLHGVVTEIDEQAEREIIQIIHKSYPDHGILGEETGSQECENESEYVWIIDPLDGTANFVHGLPHFCVSIAVRKGDLIEHGVIYDPIREELFTASRGEGCQMNDRRMRLAQRGSLSGALITTGLHFSSAPNPEALAKMVGQFSKSGVSFRHSGSTALDLAYVAAGRMDGAWDLQVPIWDAAAGLLMIREAGGIVTDFFGEEHFASRGNLVAACPRLFGPIFQVIEQNRDAVLGLNEPQA